MALRSVFLAIIASPGQPDDLGERLWMFGGGMSEITLGQGGKMLHDQAKIGKEVDAPRLDSWIDRKAEH